MNIEIKDLPFAICEQVHFIVQNRLLKGYVARYIWDGKDIRIEISREPATNGIWSVPLERVAKCEKSVT